MILTVCDMGVKELFIHGPIGTKEYIECLKLFLTVRIGTFNLISIEFSDEMSSVNYDEITVKAFSFNHDNTGSDENCIII